MVVRLVLWNLADSKSNIAELRRYLREESVDQFGAVPGLRFKAWISDEATERWGAVYIWESAEAARQPLPSRARELIGKTGAGRDPLEPEGREIERRRQSQGLLRDRAPHSGTLHEPVPGEAAGREDAVADAAENRVPVGRHVVEAGP